MLKKCGWCHLGELRYVCYGATSSGAQIRTIVTLIPAEQGRYRLKLCHLNFDPYPSRTGTRPWVTLVATHTIMRISLF